MSRVSAHPARLDDDALLAQIREERRKHSGPGGQRRNKVATGVRWTHEPTGVVVEASERRHTKENRREALRRLRFELALQHREPVDLEAGAPSELMRNRTAGSRLSLAATHADVPPLVAEALDVFAACDEDAGRAAEWLGLSVSRLVKLLKLHPPALAAFNERLAARGRNTYR